MARLILSLRPAVVAGLALFGAATAEAATPASYAKLDRASSAACLKAAAMRGGRVGPVTRFSDRTGMDARVVTGIWPQPHMKGAAATMLCLYDRRSRRAEVQELAGGVAAPAPPTPSAPIAQIKDRRWQILAIDGRPPVVGPSPVTLMFGSDGNIAANSGCNGFGGRYMMTGEGLKIYGPMIGTQMACAPEVMEQERRLQAILAAAQMLKPQPGGRLLLGAAGGRTILLSADTAPSQPMAFTTYRCGDRLAAMNLSSTGAIVELDGERIQLPNRGGADPEAPRLYTNGRVTVFQTIEGPDRGVSLAIGKAAAQRCEPIRKN